MIDACVWCSDGFNNNVREILNTVMIAKMLNRTACMPDFGGWYANSDVNDTYSFANAIDIDSLGALPAETCAQMCGRHIDVLIRLYHHNAWPFVVGPNEFFTRSGFAYTGNEHWIHIYPNELESWSTADDMRTSLFTNAKCVGFMGSFIWYDDLPGGWWNQALARFHFAAGAVRVAHEIINRLFPRNTPYLAVHWRQEEQWCSRAKS